MMEVSLLHAHAVRFLNCIYCVFVRIPIKESDIVRMAATQHLLCITLDASGARIRPKAMEIARSSPKTYFSIQIGLRESVWIAPDNALLPDLIRARNGNILDVFFALSFPDIFRGVFEIRALCCSLVLDPEVFLLLCVPEIAWYCLAVHIGGAR